jgi:hypothetical protein
MRSLFFLWFTVAGGSAEAQGQDSSLHYRVSREHHDELTLRTGYHQGTYGFFEVGIGRSIFGMGHLPYGAGLHMGVETRVDRLELLGYKAGFFISAVFAFGAHYIRYVEGGDGMDVLRPELGFGLGKAKVTYAYNLRLSKPELPGVSTHMLSLNYDLRLLRLSGDERRRVHH